MAADRRLLAGTLGIALIVAACGSSGASAAPSAAATAGAPTEPAATEATESEAPGATDEAQATDDSGTEASFTAGGSAELEALLPDSVGGKALTKTSFDGSNLGAAGLGIDTGELDPILSANGKSISDVRMAIASPTDQTSGTPTVIIALQVKGLDASKLAELAGATAGVGQTTNATIGGKQVQKFGEGAFGGAMYIKDDVLFEVLFADDAALQEVISQLP